MTVLVVENTMDAPPNVPEKNLFGQIPAITLSGARYIRPT